MYGEAGFLRGNSALAKTNVTEGLMGISARPMCFYWAASIGARKLSRADSFIPARPMWWH